MTPPAAPQRFRATVRLQGPYSYVDIPSRVSQAFEEYSRSGRIRVDGKLKTASIRGTLIPKQGGGHRLYVNGGMRSAAGVKAGDTVSFELRAMTPEVVPLPSDLAAALRRSPEVWKQFAALAPSHRRELVRFIDDARTLAARKLRIEQTASHVMGEPAQVLLTRRQRPLWTCPKCGNEFVNHNQYHSCERHDLARLFKGKPAWIRELFQQFRTMVESCGPVKMLAYRDRIGFMVRVRFAGAIPRRRWLEIVFWLRRRLHDARLQKIETLYPHVHIHHIRITEPEQLDQKVEAWLREAYAVGCQLQP
jgi:hypothetical protein